MRNENFWAFVSALNQLQTLCCCFFGFASSFILYIWEKRTQVKWRAWLSDSHSFLYSLDTVWGFPSLPLLHIPKSEQTVFWMQATMHEFLFFSLLLRHTWNIDSIWFLLRSVCLRVFRLMFRSIFQSFHMVFIYICQKNGLFVLNTQCVGRFEKAALKWHKKKYCEWAEWNKCNAKKADT